MALPVYAEEDPLPGAPDEVELLEDGQGTASGEDTVPPEQNAATPVPDAATPEPEQSAEPEQPAGPDYRIRSCRHRQKTPNSCNFASRLGRS